MISCYQFINRTSATSKEVWKEYRIHQQRYLRSLTMDKFISVLQHSWTTKAFQCTVLSKNFDTG